MIFHIASFLPQQATFTYLDNCGYKLTVTVSCGNCTGQQLGAFADNYAQSRTGSDGCFTNTPV